MNVMNTDMFASGIGGVHAWEISLVKFNRYLLVSSLTYGHRISQATE